MGQSKRPKQGREKVNGQKHDPQSEGAGQERHEADKQVAASQKESREEEKTSEQKEGRSRSDQLAGAKDESTSRQLGQVPFYLLALLVGIVAGLGAVVFRGMIAVFHNLFFLQKLSWTYDANVHTPSNPWGPLVILVPVIGALGVVFLVKNFAPEAKGHGVPEVMEAIYYKKGIIRPIVAAIKSVASALSIGTGGSVGREGPIIQIGSSFGSTISQVLKLSVWQRITLIAAGAGGGIAATFNTPVGGILFAIEIMMLEVSVRTLVPVGIATAAATYMGRMFFGAHPSFVVPSFETVFSHLTDLPVLLSYAVLGLLIGLVAALYTKSIYWFEDIFDGLIRKSYYLRHTAGMLIIGVMMYALQATLGHYYIQGVGYATVQDVLSGKLTQIPILSLLFVLKLLAVSITLGSGASGGIFSPGLFMGATFGATYGIVLQAIFPSLPVSPPALAAAGMAGVIGGSTGAAMTGVVMIFEMTRNYAVIIPLIVTVVLADGVRRRLSAESIYTMKAARRGRHIPDALETDIYQLERADEVMSTSFLVVDAGTLLDQFLKKSHQQRADWYLVADQDRIIGTVHRDDAVEQLEESDRKVSCQEITRPGYVTVAEDMTLFIVIDRLRSKQASVAVVTEGGDNALRDNVKGVIGKREIGETLEKNIELFSD